MTDTWDLFAHVAAITGWLDASNPGTPHEDSMRVLKLVEEAGEAAAAYIGMVGQNPRKGVTHTRDQFLAELADVALTALCAMQHFTQDADATRSVLATKVERIIKRADIRPLVETPPGLLHYSANGTGGVCGIEGWTATGEEFHVAFDPADSGINCPPCRAWLAAQRRTPEQWCALYGVRVYDPDGWRGPDAPDWYQDALGLREFSRRAAGSTTDMAASGAHERIARDLALLPQDTVPAATGGA